MRLEVHERIALMELLAVEHEHYAALKNLRRAREMISFDPDELSKLKFQQQNVNGTIQLAWDMDAGASMVRDIPIDEYITNRIRTTLAQLEAKGELNDRQVSLYEKFIIDYS